MSSEKIVRFDREGVVGVVTLNRPESMNAINLEMRRVLADTIEAAEADGEVRAIVIRGAGDRAFCAGADVKEFKAADSLNAERQGRQPPRWNDLIAASRKPTIAAIQGVCLGGGLEMALACDLRIASREAIFGLPEVRLALIPGAGGTQRLPRTIGIGMAKELIYTARRFDAAEALRIGFVNHVYPAGELQTRAAELAAEIAANGPLAVQAAKHAIDGTYWRDLPAWLLWEAEQAVGPLLSQDRKAGMRGAAERKRADFQGT